MGQRRSGPLFAMVVLALMGVVFFGGMVWWMSDKPVIKLRPELEKLSGVKGFRCSLHLNEGRLDIEVPPELDLSDRFARRRLGAEALNRYLRLTKNRTQVTWVQLLPSGEAVSRDAAQRWQEFEPFLAEVARVAANEGAPLLGKPLHAPGMTGVAVRVDLDGDAAAAQKAAAKLLRLPHISFLEVRARGKVLSESGVDAKLYAAGAVAPVGSPAR